jgi:hypothetical protein
LLDDIREGGKLPEEELTKAITSFKERFQSDKDKPAADGHSSDPES